MTKLYHFLRLIRFLNLIVIVLTMVIVQYFVSHHLYFTDKNIIDLDLNPHASIEILMPAFILLVISTVLIAAAGNIINDYFDVKADRINKPDRLIIDTHIKRRWAMVWHWSFNLIGFILSLYVGYLVQSIWIPIAAFLSTNLLWFYSVYYKRKPFTGNFIVATLLGGVPFYILILNYNRMNLLYDTSIEFAFPKEYYIVTIFCIAFLALLMNLIRELIKDIMDIRGDLRLEAKTFPIKYGIKKTKILITIVAFLLLGLSGFYYSYIQHYAQIEQSGSNQFIDLNFFNPTLIIAVMIMAIALFITLKNNKNKWYRMASNLIKVAIVFGLLTILFI